MMITRNAAGCLLDDITRGTKTNRRAFLMNVLTRTLATGCEGKTAYKLAKYANKHLSNPLPKREVGTLFITAIEQELSEIQED